MLKQIRIGVVGLQDSGKSTFIGQILKQVIGKDLQPDTLMKEVHWSDGKDPSGNPDTRTIKCAKIMFKWKDVEFLFYDCPGHQEYKDQILQGIQSSHHIIILSDNERYKESKDYIYNFLMENIKDVPYTHLISHSRENILPNYDVNVEGFKELVINLLNELYDKYKKQGIDIEQEALSLVDENIKYEKKNGMFFSGGKDSLVGLDLIERVGKLDWVNVYFPHSSYDFNEVEDMIKYYSKYYKKDIIPFDNNGGKSYEKNTPFEMLQEKSFANNKLINQEHLDLVCVQYRSSDEGVRSKDYHLRWRENHYRFSGVFYFSETNIWRYILKRNLKVCPLYFQGYRSLGDFPITIPCMDSCENIEQIIDYIDNNPQTNERDGRKKQDNTQKFTMEKLRDGGFF